MASNDYRMDAIWGREYQHMNSISVALDNLGRSIDDIDEKSDDSLQSQNSEDQESDEEESDEEESDEDEDDADQFDVEHHAEAEDDLDDEDDMSVEGHSFSQSKSYQVRSSAVTSAPTLDDHLPHPTIVRSNHSLCRRSSSRWAPAMSLRQLKVIIRHAAPPYISREYLRCLLKVEKFYDKHVPSNEKKLYQLEEDILPMVSIKVCT